MENSKSNEDFHNQSPLADDDRLRITFEKNEVAKLENMKLKEKLESNAQPDSNEEQSEAADGPNKLTGEHCLSKEDSSNELANGKHLQITVQDDPTSLDLTKKQAEINGSLHKLLEQHCHRKENSAEDPLLHGEPQDYLGSNSGLDLTKEQTRAADTHTRGTEQHSHGQKNSVNDELLNEEQPGKNGQEYNTPADMIKEQDEATDIPTKEPEPQLHIENDSAKGELSNEEHPGKNGQESNTPANLIKDQDEATDIPAKEPEPELHIENDSAKGELSNEEHQSKDRQESNTPADLIKDQDEATDIPAKEPEPQLHIENNSVKGELSNEHPSKDRQESNIPADLIKKQDEATDIPAEEPEPQLHIENDSMRGDLPTEELQDISLPDLENILQIQEHTLSKEYSSKNFPPVYSQITEPVTEQDTLCSCSDKYKKKHPNVCPTKLSLMRKSILDSMGGFQPIFKDPLERNEFLDTKSNVETAPQFYNADTQLITLKGFSREYYEEVFCTSETPNASSETDYNTANWQSISSEVPPPISAIPMMLNGLNKRDAAHKQSPVSKLLSSDFFKGKDDDRAQREFHEALDKYIASLSKYKEYFPDSEDLRIRKQFGNFEDYPFSKCETEVFNQSFGQDFKTHNKSSPPKRTRISSPSSPNGSMAQSGNAKRGRYVQMSPTDVVSIKENHLVLLSSLRNGLVKYSSSIMRNEGNFVVRYVRKFASSALDTLATFVEEMEEKVKDDMQFMAALLEMSDENVN